MVLIRVCVQRNHRPLLHGGVVMKINDNQRYATTSVTQAVLREVAAAAGVPVQRVCVRNDSACGSTIGPLLSTRLAMRTVDVGMPQWAMHSIREVCCTSSIAQAIALYTVCARVYIGALTRVHMRLQAFYKHCARVLAQIDIE
jgi:aspartyl aminopeptidase